jgi:hypothetical protein
MASLQASNTLIAAMGRMGRHASSATASRVAAENIEPHAHPADEERRPTLKDAISRVKAVQKTAQPSRRGSVSRIGGFNDAVKKLGFNDAVDKLGFNDAVNKLMKLRMPATTSRDSIVSLWDEQSFSSSNSNDDLAARLKSRRISLPGLNDDDTSSSGSGRGRRRLILDEGRVSLKMEACFLILIGLMTLLSLVLIGLQTSDLLAWIADASFIALYMRGVRTVNKAKTRRQRVLTLALGEAPVEKVTVLELTHPIQVIVQVVISSLVPLMCDITRPPSSVFRGR